MSAFIPSSLYGVIGWPLAQSLSPLLHNTAFQALGIPAAYMLCRSGNRSGQAMRLLRQWGRDDVLHLADGFRSWRAAGLPEE